MLEQIVLGIIQSITEWIPVSSEGCVVFVKTTFFNKGETLNAMINQALLLHLGTLFAAFIYFWKDIAGIFRSLARPAQQDAASRNLLVFLTLTTIISGGLGYLIVKKMSGELYRFPHAAAGITLLIGACLVVTGFLQLKAPTDGKRQAGDTTIKDGLILGLTQAFATLPGLSRSGTTIAVLLLSRFQKDQALKLSFLMSMPIILFGNILLNFKKLAQFGEAWLGVLVAFVVGILSIRFFMEFARRINFGVFLLLIGGLMILSTFLK